MTNPHDDLMALAPCPFCHGAPYLHEQEGQRPEDKRYSVHCDGCDATHDTPSKDAAVAAWNRRTAASRPATQQTTSKLGAWLAAALDDPNVCAEMKADIEAWMNAGEPAHDHATQVVDREARHGAHLFATAKSLGWLDDGEGPLEFMIRRTREVAFEDAGKPVTSFPSRPATQVVDREAVARVLCQSGKFETGQGTCAVLCMDQLGDVRKKGCGHCPRVHGKLADAILSLLRTAAPAPNAKDEPVASKAAVNLIARLIDGYAGKRPFPFNRIDLGPVVAPVYAVDDRDLKLLFNAAQSPAPSHSGNLRDFTTHRASWRKAIEQARDYAPLDDGESNDRLYWDHELKAFDKAFDVLAASQSGEAEKMREALKSARSSLMQMCDGTNWPDIAQRGDGFQAYQEACDIIEAIADEINTAIRALPLPSDDGEVRS